VLLPVGLSLRAQEASQALRATKTADLPLGRQPGVARDGPKQAHTPVVAADREHLILETAARTSGERNVSATELADEQRVGVELLVRLDDGVEIQ
jgi:hypothetical protein